MPEDQSNTPSPCILSFYIRLADQHLDGYRLERYSSKTSRLDRRVCDTKWGERSLPASREDEGDFRARTGNGPWIRAETMVGALRSVLLRRYGAEWLQRMELQEVKP